MQQFKDLVVGAKFSYNGETYTRIEDDRHSCCLVYNAQKDNTNEKVMIMPLENVEVS
jgi:hypothetical protein